jgi:two-component system sensor histidine kinase VicK
MSKSEQEQIINYWALFRELPEAYLLIKADAPRFTIVDMNKARETLTGPARNQAVGRPCFEVYPGVNPSGDGQETEVVRRRLLDVLRSGKPKQLETLRYDMADESGVRRQRYWRSIYLPVRLGTDRNITYILARTVDVTDETQVERRIANVEDRLEAALSIGKVSSWVWHINEDKVIGDRNLAKLFGVESDEAAKGLSVERFIAHIHADDRPRVQRSIERTLRERVPYDEEYRIVSAAGKVRWVLARGKVDDRANAVLFPGVIVDITERRDLQAQVELARRQDQLNRREAKILHKRNEELETISRTKDEFVALASHQLRTPATAVKQYLGMVLQGYVGAISDIQREMLQKAFESNERQIQIINQILNAARVDTGRLIMTAMPLDVGALAKGIADDMRPVLEQRQHEFVVRLPKNPVLVAADAGYLRMAIENLLHNASIYTPEGGRVELDVARAGTQVRVSVTDTGVGIKKADIGKLFTKFSRIHNALSVQAGGSGIGLYLTAEIIRLHNGTVTVESRAGRGTTFAILLPLEENKIKAERGSSAA